MDSIVKARGLSKRYGSFRALDNISLEVGQGRIVGLIGPNGAGKTTALRCLLGLSTYEGELNVLGKNPKLERMHLLHEVAYIADTAVLPSWIKVEQLLEYMTGTHPKFDRSKAQTFLDQTEIMNTSRVSQLSKGMVTQLHLALAISIDAKFLVLDEPTLGLDILYRKRFYQQLLNDYFDEGRTILITTHQVEEVEQLLTDLIFIKQGKIVLDIEMEDMAQSFIEIEVQNEFLESARALKPISERSTLAGTVLLFENARADELSKFGRVRAPSIADLFMAKMA